MDLNTGKGKKAQGKGKQDKGGSEKRKHFRDNISKRTKAARKCYDEEDSRPIRDYADITDRGTARRRELKEVVPTKTILEIRIQLCKDFKIVNFMQ